MNIWGILLLILKILAWIVLGIIALIVLALFIPVTVEISYFDKILRVSVRYLFLRFKVFDSSKKKKTVEETQKEPKKDEEKVQEQEEKEKKKGLDFGLIKKLLQPGWKAAWALLQSLWIRDVQVVVVAKGNDFADVGINAGRIWAAVGVGMTFVNSIWKRVEYKEISVLPDFAGELENHEKYSCKITSLPVIMLIIALDFFVKYTKITSEQADSKQPHKENAQAVEQQAV